MKDYLLFYKKNLERLKELGSDCPQCIQERVMCHHYDYLRHYIEELEALPPFDDEKFDFFWAAYPRKIAKVIARKAWLHLKINDKLFETIMTALENHKKSAQWTKDKGRFIPHPTTWLHQQRWEDELELPGDKGNKKYEGL